IALRVNSSLLEWSDVHLDMQFLQWLQVQLPPRMAAFDADRRRVHLHECLAERLVEPSVGEHQFVLANIWLEVLPVDSTGHASDLENVHKVGVENEFNREVDRLEVEILEREIVEEYVVAE